MTVPARRPVDDALDRLVRLIPPSPDPRRMDAISDVATVREALERLREERDAAHRTAAVECERVEAAEAEVQRLTGIVRDIRDSSTSSWTSPEQTLRIVAVALDALLADSPDGANPIGWRVLPDGGGAK